MPKTQEPVFILIEKLKHRYCGRILQNYCYL